MTTTQSVPVFKLYGEHQDWPTPDLLHCEAIADRSRPLDWVIRPHRHAGLFQLLYLRQGRALVQHESEQHELGPGGLVVVPEMSVHGFEFDAHAQGLVLTLANPLVQRLGERVSAALLTQLLSEFRLCALNTSRQHSAIDNALQQIHAEYVGREPGRTALMEAQLAALLVRLIRHCLPGGGTLTETAGGAVDHFGEFSRLIERHYADGWTLALYAHELGITTAHLNGICRRTVGQSALQLVHQRILLEAKRLLVYTAQTVAQVGDRLGFSDPGYFTRFFKRQTGQSPRDFRRYAGTSRW
ncbi:helix-turn-helix domain-containing protein [Saccharospirillum mangrovi]|uniref:helix-turn-helix domain-containing protein n=1 Tax=Saccharospirillum mangrovi TaxID=2161747 RepID=UPI000D36ABA0|nr:helix-turn-helix domain-containing protein [Saccharospirillum mangrovi]